MNILSLLACSIAVVNAASTRSVMDWDNLLSEINYADMTELPCKQVRNNLLHSYVELAQSDPKLASVKADVHLRSALLKRNEVKDVYKRASKSVEKAESFLKSAAKNNALMNEFMVIFENESEKFLSKGHKDLKQAQKVTSLIFSARKLFQKQQNGQNIDNLSSGSDSFDSVDEGYYI